MIDSLDFCSSESMERNGPERLSCGVAEALNS
jgi:hypothetical protein